MEVGTTSSCSSVLQDAERLYIGNKDQYFAEGLRRAACLNVVER